MFSCDPECQPALEILQRWQINMRTYALQCESSKMPLLGTILSQRVNAAKRLSQIKALPTVDCTEKVRQNATSIGGFFAA
jgi:hypothetical protein